MTLTAEEKRLFHLYRSGSVAETAAVIRDALKDISEPEVRIAAEGLLMKLEDYAERLSSGREDCYA